MDTGTKAASIQSCDTAAAMLFQIASKVFEATRNSQVDPELKQPSYAVWLELRRVASAIARERGVSAERAAQIFSVNSLLMRAHTAMALSSCQGSFSSGQPYVRHFELCNCETAGLCRSAAELIFTPGSSLPNQGEEKGGRGQSPEHCAGAVQAVPAKLQRFVDGVSDRL